MPKIQTKTTKPKAIKKATPIKVKDVALAEPVYEEINIPSSATPEATAYQPISKQFKLLVITLAVIAGLICAVYFLRSFYLAAWVNNRPIFRYKLNQEMSKAVGADILENMIVQELVDQETAKSGITVSPDRLQQEIDKITKTLGAGITLEDALKFQGMTMEDFNKQVTTRIKLNELLGKEVSVSGEEVDQFIQENSQMLTATGVAEKRVEAEEQLKNQKLTEKIQEWLKTLQDKAKITRFLE